MTSTLLSLHDSWTRKDISSNNILLEAVLYKHMHAEKMNRKLIIVYSKTDEKQSTRTRIN
jgi:hypothetical protein